MEKYVIYLDILGFDHLPKEISKKTGIHENIIRQTFFSERLKKTVTELKTEFVKSISEIEGSDSYILLFDKIYDLQYGCGKLLTIDIPHEDYDFIPLEIAIDVIEYDEKNIDLINNDNIINFLKYDIISPFRNEYKKKNKISIKNSFIVSTEKFYEKMDNFDKDRCIYYKIENKKFYCINNEDMIIKVKLHNFLNNIGIPIISTYNKINDLFVEPMEFKEINKILNEKRFVILTGTPEFGKTYTAVRLLWDYYLKGYYPVWEKGSETTERLKVRAGLENIQQYLLPKHITYLEDPFGKIKYEKRESLERTFGDIVNHIKNSKDSIIILTSREEIFKTFLKERLTEEEINEFETKLNIKKPSYNYYKRCKIISQWAKYFDCKWLKDKKLKNMIIDEMNDESILPSPLSIKSFAISTRFITDKNILMDEMEEKSKETIYAFADEIVELEDNLLLFLFFPFVGDIEINIIEKNYNIILNSLKISSEMDFYKIINWFYYDKISLIENKIMFSHPSYFEAFEYVLINKQKSRFYSLLKDFLMQFSLIVEINFYLITFIDNYYEFLDKETREKCIENIIRDKKNYKGIGNILINNYEDLSLELKNTLLLNLSQDINESMTVMRLVREKKYPIKNNINLIYNISISGNKDANYELLNYLINNYEKSLLKDIKKIISNIVYNNPDSIDEYIKNIYYESLDTIKKTIIYELIKNKHYSNTFSIYIYQKFIELDYKKIRKYFERSDKEYSKDARMYSKILLKYFKKIEIELINKSIIDLTNYDNAITNVIEIIKKYKKELDKEIVYVFSCRPIAG